MENYYQAKRSLFLRLEKEGKEGKFAVINIDDSWGERLKNSLSLPVYTYGINKKADFQAVDLKLEREKTSFLVKGKGLNLSLDLKLLGFHNVYNALAAAATSWILKIEAEKIKGGLEKVSIIPGRMEKVNCDQDFSVVIDFAHTPAALENILKALQKLAPGKVITVFGCGGDRDRAKRPLMGEIASLLSKEVILTSDNPRSEDPERIILDIEVGIRRLERNNYQIEIDRRKAIEKALLRAEKGDIVLIAGKGHENYQIFKDKKIPFSDRRVVEEFFKKKKKG